MSRRDPFLRLMNQVLTLVHPFDATTGFDWGTAATRIALTGNLQQVVTTEDSGGFPAATPDSALTTWTLFLAYGPTVRLVDRIEQGTRIYEVVGRPSVVYWPGGLPHHLEVQLRCVDSDDEGDGTLYPSPGLFPSLSLYPSGD